MKDIINTHALKYALGFAVVFAIRLLPFRPPNVEPVMATLMPFSKEFDVFGAFLFGFLSIALFDSVTSGIGMWTVITAFAYGFIGVGGAYFFKHRAANVRNFVSFALISTILYDAVTGLSIGPLFYGQPFMVALTGQIPFTALHLLGNIALAVALSPLVHRFIVANPRMQLGSIAKQKAA